MMVICGDVSQRGMENVHTEARDDGDAGGGGAHVASTLIIIQRAHGGCGGGRGVRCT